VECDEESNGFGGKSDGNEDGRRLTATRAMAMVMAPMWVMVMVTRLAGNQEGKGEGGKGDGDGDEGGARYLLSKLPNRGDRDSHVDTFPLL